MTEDGWVVRHISFSWTTRALEADAKNVTRRRWNDNWARRWKKGDYAVAYDRNPAWGGAQIALIRLTETPYKENTADIPDDDWEGEGFAYMQHHRQLVNGIAPREFWDKWKREPEEVWVIRFEVVKLVTGEFDGQTGHHDFAGAGEECDVCSQGPESTWHERSRDNG